MRARESAAARQQTEHTLPFVDVNRNTAAALPAASRLRLLARACRHAPEPRRLDVAFAAGDARERTQWHQIVIFNENIGRIAEQYLKKGSQVYLEGAIRTRKYTAQDGSERYTTEIVLAAFRGELTLLGSAGQRPAAEESSYGTTRTKAPAATAGGGLDPDDDIPF